MIIFGDRLKQLRLREGLTQEQLASKFHLNKSSISRYENNTQLPENELLQKLADFFCVSIDYLLGRDTDFATNIDNRYSFESNNPNIEILLPSFFDYLENERNSLMLNGEIIPNEIWTKLKESLLDELEFAKLKRKYKK